MNWKSLFCALSVMMPIAANASIQYRVEETSYAATQPAEYGMGFAAEYPLYIGAAYNYSMWSDFTDNDNVAVSGKGTSSFDISAGYRVSNIFRIEADYAYTKAKWDGFALNGNTAMVNAIFDARIDAAYRLFRSQHIVPYVGAGAGMTWLHASGADNKNVANWVFGLMAGISFEFGGWWAYDLGYKYLYVMSPDMDTISDLTPTAHQFRAGVRFSF